MCSLVDFDTKKLEVLNRLRATLATTIEKSQPADMKRNLKAVKVTVEGILHGLARQDDRLAPVIEPFAHPPDEDLLDESKRLLDSIDRSIHSIQTESQMGADRR